MIVDVNPEFGIELTLAVPYAYWLHTNNLLGKVNVCKGMAPYYYFADNVNEIFEQRDLDNNRALKDIPNKWLHHNATSVMGKEYSELTLNEQNLVNGVVDYSKWICPPYKEYYKNNLFDEFKPFIVVNNIFNSQNGEYGFKPYRYFDIQNLYDIFTYLTEKGYTVIYKRPENSEFPNDPNESMSNSSDLTANVEGVGIINDYQLCEYFDNVFELNKLHKTKFNNLDYSTLNLKLFAESSGFISVNGAGSQLCACYGKPIILYIRSGIDMRTGYYQNDNCYMKRLSGSPIFTVYDDYRVNNKRLYSELNNIIKTVF